MNRPTLVVPAAVLVFINGKLFGKCASFSWQSITQHKEIETVDVMEPVELAVTRTKVAFNMGVLRQVGDGGLQGAGVMAPQASVSLEKYFTILLIERRTNLPIFRCDYCVGNVENWVLQPKSMMLGTLQGAGTIWTNEAS